MIARVLGLIDPPPTRTTPTGESDILHPLLLIFDIRSPSGLKVYPGRSRASSEEGRIPCEGRPGRRESVDRLRDPRAALGGTRTCDRQPRRCRVVSLHESSEPVPERAVRSLERAPRGVLPRDDRDLPVPADAHHRGGGAPDPRPSRIPAMSGMRSAPRYPDRGGARSPPPDRADAATPREKGRLRGSPPQGRRRGALIVAGLQGAFSTRHRGTQNTEAISGPGVASIGSVARAT